MTLSKQTQYFSLCQRCLKRLAQELGPRLILARCRLIEPVTKRAWNLNGNHYQFFIIQKTGTLRCSEHLSRFTRILAAFNSLCKLLNNFIRENAAALRHILHMLQTLSNYETCYNIASGCPCLGLRATPFDVGKTVRRLSSAVFRFTGALTPCCGHGLDHQCRQARQRSDKPHHLDNQVHGQLTSFPQGRRCQHTGLIPLTTPNYITKSNIRSLFAHIDSSRKAT